MFKSWFVKNIFIRITPEGFDSIMTYDLTGPKWVRVRLKRVRAFSIKGDNEATVPAILTKQGKVGEVSADAGPCERKLGSN